MYMERKQHILENLIYAIIWLVILIVPVFSFYSEGTVEWKEARQYWLTILPFFLLFIINNYALIPFFLLRKRSWIYLLAIAGTVAILFTVWPGRSFVKRVQPFPDGREFVDQRGRQGPPPGMREGQFPPNHQLEGERPRELQEQFRDGRRPLHKPFFPPPILIDWMIALLVVGLNLAMRFLFKSMRDDRQIKELEKQTLQAELNYLKAQVNPHFFMNTLNNIHALIDIDTEKAKETVIELSKIMRYVLYEAEQARVPLGKEIQFLENYTALMRIRYADGVDIQTTFPEVVPEAQIPPLLLVTLLENAYKHGISYRRKSFVYSTLQVVNERLAYMVMNSTSTDTQPQGGVGMENLRKRLSLLYPNNYTLDVEQNEDEYVVTLNIPIS